MATITISLAGFIILVILASFTALILVGMILAIFFALITNAKTPQQTQYDCPEKLEGKRK